MENNLHEMHGFKDCEVLKMKRDRDWMLSTNNIQRKQGTFLNSSNEHDKRRNTNFLKTFEMQSFWKKKRVLE